MNYLTHPRQRQQNCHSSLQSITGGSHVPHFERIRDVISGPFSPGIIDQRLASGWQLLYIEWRRELPADRKSVV